MRLQPRARNNMPGLISDQVGSKISWVQFSIWFQGEGNVKKQLKFGKCNPRKSTRLCAKVQRGCLQWWRPAAW